MAKSYVVKAGDTLSKIAKEQLGDVNRWKEILAANKDVITDANLIKPGMKLSIPGSGTKSKSSKHSFE